MTFKSYICALDIGSSKVAASLAVLRNRRVVDMFFETQSCAAIRGGAVVDSVALVETVERLMKTLRQRSGLKVRHVLATISGKHISTRHSSAVIPLAERGNKVIIPGDVQKVVEQARILGSNIDEEILHHFPWRYGVDTNSEVTNPLGLYSHRLEVDLYLVCAKLAAVQTITHVINQAGFDVRSLTLSGLATAHAAFGQNRVKGFSVLCDIGSDVTELLIFREGVLRAIKILPLGGETVTAGLAHGLQIPFELAEDIKVSAAGVIDPASIAADKEVLIRKEALYKPVKQRQIAEIINERAAHLCSRIKQELDTELSWMEVSSCLVSGRSVLQDGLLETLERSFGVPVKVARVADAHLQEFVATRDVLSGQKYLAYLTSLGLIARELHTSVLSAPCAQPQVPRHPVKRLFAKLHDMYTEYF